MLRRSSSSTSTGDDRFTMEQLQVLQEQVDLLSQREESLCKKLRNIRRSKSTLAHQLHLIKKVTKEGQLNANATLHPCGSKRKRGEFSEDNESMEEGRYVYFSDGCTISLLDLKQSKNLKSLHNVADVRPLPKMANLKLEEEKLPMYAGLLKLGSDVYIIGGQEYQHTPNTDREYLPFKGTSCMCYRMSLAHDATLIPSKGNIIEEMKSPKVWPIVEEIDGQIHVFDSTPNRSTFVAPNWVFTHEVLERDGHWSQIPTTGSPVDRFISSHVVLGNRIYAVASRKFLVFDSKTRKWEAGGEASDSPFDPCIDEHVWHILRKGIVKCVGEYPYRISSSRNRKLYVVIGIVQPHPRFDQPCDPPYGLAYLVTSKGKIVKTQWLPHFFRGSLKPNSMVQGTIIKEGKTMCAIVDGNVKCGPFRGHIFMNTFRVEMLPPAASSKRRPFEFVRVVVKDRLIYKQDPWLMQGDSHRTQPRGVQACFL